MEHIESGDATGGLLSISLERFKRTLRRLEELRGTIERMPFFLKANYFFMIFFTTARLWQDKQALFLVLSTKPRLLDVLVLLDAGNVLRKTGDFEQASFCFGQVLRLLPDCKSQDVRLRALTGKLEVLASKYHLRREQLNGQEYREMQFLYALIAEDLYAVSGFVYKEIWTRLSGVRMLMDGFVSPGVFKRPSVSGADRKDPRVAQRDTTPSCI